MSRLNFARNCALLLLCLSTVCLAQESRGSITGKVVDPQNSVVPGATVLVTNTATNVSDKATTNQTGYFEVNFLNPGPYSVSVESAGFKKLVQTGINVSTGDRLALDLHLDIGQTTQSVEVSADAPLLDTTNAAISCDLLNLTNHTQFTGPNLTVTSSAFGSLSGQSNAGRILQFATRLQF